MAATPAAATPAASPPTGRAAARPAGVQPAAAAPPGPVEPRAAVPPGEHGPPAGGLPGGGLPVLLGGALAEAAVLGCVLRGGPAQARALLSRLGEDDWSVPAYAHVAQAAAELLARGEPVDPVTVLGQLRRRGTASARSGSTEAGVLLIELCQGAPCLSSGTFYLRIVLEQSYRRRAQQAALRLLQAAETGPLDHLRELADREHAALAAAHQRTVHLAPPA